MDVDLVIVIALAGVGLILGYLLAHLRGQSTLAGERERSKNLKDQLDRREMELEGSRRQLSETAEQLATLNADHRNLQRRLEEQRGEMEKLQERFTKEFENLANKILDEKSRKFTEQNKETLDQLLKPLSTKIEEFRKQVESSHKDTVKGQSALHQHLRLMQEHNRQISEDAKNLTRALKGESKTQGIWGEFILQRVLEMSGLVKGREYEIQQSLTSDDGRRLQPDVVVHLPEEKRLIIDSKVSLTAYLRSVGEEEDSVRDKAVRDHVVSIRSHVRRLGAKNYQQLYGGASPDFVLLFIENEPAFALAVTHDPGLYADAFEQGIVIVSPSTLLATLKTIESIWKREYQNKNALEIADRGGKLYDKFVGFVESLEQIGGRIRQAQSSYDDALGRLSDGPGNLVRQVEMLRKLGAKSTKQLPSGLLDDPDFEEVEEDEDVATS